MIDLANPLPSCFIIDGVEYKIKTDFRVWLKVERMLKERPKLWLFLFIFEDGQPTPTADFAEHMVEFLVSENATPKSYGESGDKVLDHFLDGEYIYSSVLHYYGIDLIDVEHLHWHKFKAMVGGLGDDTKMGKIMGYRSYTKPSKNQKPEQVYQKLKSAWKLPDDSNDHEAVLEEIDALFYNS